MEWISVKDRLPDCIGYYLVWKPNENRLWFCFYNSDGKWCTGNEYLENITHWMSLPDPPIEK